MNSIFLPLSNLLSFLKLQVFGLLKKNDMALPPLCRIPCSRLPELSNLSHLIIQTRLTTQPSGKILFMAYG